MIVWGISSRCSSKTELLEGGSKAAIVAYECPSHYIKFRATSTWCTSKDHTFYVGEVFKQQISILFLKKLKNFNFLFCSNSHRSRNTKLLERTENLPLYQPWQMPRLVYQSLFLRYPTQNLWGSSFLTLQMMFVLFIFYFHKLFSTTHMWNALSYIIFKHIQLWTFAYVRLLNKPYENEVTLRR